MLHDENIDELTNALEVLLDDIASEDGKVFTVCLKRLCKTPHSEIYKLVLEKTTLRQDKLYKDEVNNLVHRLVEEARNWQDTDKEIAIQTLVCINKIYHRLESKAPSMAEISALLAEFLKSEDSELNESVFEIGPKLASRLTGLTPLVEAIIERIQGAKNTWKTTRRYNELLIAFAVSLSKDNKEQIKEYLTKDLNEFVAHDSQERYAFGERINLLMDFTDFMDEDMTAKLSERYQDAADRFTPDVILNVLGKGLRKRIPINQQNLSQALATRIMSKTSATGVALAGEIKLFFKGVSSFYKSLEQPQKLAVVEAFRNFGGSVNLKSFRTPWGENFSKLHKKAKVVFISTYVLETPRGAKPVLDRVNQVLQVVRNELAKLDFSDTITEMANRIQNGMRANVFSSYCDIILSLKSGTKREIQTVADLVVWLLSPSSKSSFLKHTLRFIPNYFGDSIPEDLRKRMRDALVEALSRQTKKTKEDAKKIRTLLVKYQLIKGKTREINKYLKRIGLPKVKT